MHRLDAEQKCINLRQSSRQKHAMPTETLQPKSSVLPQQLQLTPEEFTDGITKLHEAFGRLGCDETEWMNVRLQGSVPDGIPITNGKYNHVEQAGDVATALPPYLTIDGAIRHPDPSMVPGGPTIPDGRDSFSLYDKIVDETELNEDDEEALRRRPAYRTNQIHAIATYDVIYSPTYCVPVLYLRLTNTAWRRPATLDEAIEILVPRKWQAQMRTGGPLGSLTVTDHPVDGLPAFFVHPCRTGEAMAEVAAGRELNGLEYLLLWIGLVGAGVRFSVPSGLAEALGREKGA